MVDTPFNYDLLLRLVQDVPMDLDRKGVKENTPPDVRKLVNQRDNYACQLCGFEGQFGSVYIGRDNELNIHHIIPNGEANLDNLVTLCNQCHRIIHLLLYRTKKWRFPHHMMVKTK